MENASKALLMAVSILIAIMILSLATRMFGAASRVTKSYDETMEISTASSFNTRFTKFIGDSTNSSGAEQKYATIYDVISLVHFAKSYNRTVVDDPATLEERYNLANADPALVRIDLRTANGVALRTITNLQKYDEKVFNKILQECHYIDNGAENAKRIITYEMEITKQNNVGRICHVTFIPIVEGNTTQTIVDILNGIY